VLPILHYCRSSLARKQLDAPLILRPLQVPSFRHHLKADAEEFREHLIRLIHIHLMRRGFDLSMTSSSLSWPSLCVLQKQQLPAPRCRLCMYVYTASQLIFLRGWQQKIRVQCHCNASASSLLLTARGCCFCLDPVLCKILHHRHHGPVCLYLSDRYSWARHLICCPKRNHFTNYL
jgi:hypothetical protein